MISTDDVLEGTLHSGRHTQQYYDYVEKALMNATDNKSAKKILKSIEDGLKNGTIAL